jgi:hypothetical protein
VLVDGQPRSYDQVVRFMELRRELPTVRFHFLLLTASENERRKRAMNRFKPEEPQYQEKLDLANQRITNDMLTYYRVLTQLMASPFHQYIDVVDTTEKVDHPGLLARLDLLNQ